MPENVRGSPNIATSMNITASKGTYAFTVRKNLCSVLIASAVYPVILSSKRTRVPETKAQSISHATSVLNYIGYLFVQHRQTILSQTKLCPMVMSRPGIKIYKQRAFFKSAKKTFKIKLL